MFPGALNHLMVSARPLSRSYSGDHPNNSLALRLSAHKYLCNDGWDDSPGRLPWAVCIERSHNDYGCVERSVEGQSQEIGPGF